MSKIGEFKELFNCKFCFKLIEDPILLPCGESVCMQHSQEICSKECVFCDQEHSEPENGFIPNKVIQRMLDLEVEKISLHIQASDTCQKVISELTALDSQIDSIKRDPKNLIYEHFAKLRNDIDLRKENLASSLEKCYVESIEEIRQAESKCDSRIHTLCGISQIDPKEDFQKLIKRYESFEIGFFL